MIAAEETVSSPAAPSRRRRFLFGLLLLVGLAGMGAAHLPLGLSATPPNSHAFRAAVQRSLRALYALDPRSARHLEDLRHLAEVAEAQERALPPWRRSAGRIEASWMRALRVAHRELARIRADRLESEERWRELAGELEPAVRAAHQTSRSTGLGRKEVAAAERALVEWRLAQIFAQSGQYDRAFEAATRARLQVELIEHSHRELQARFTDPRNLQLWRRWVAEAIARSRDTGETVFVVDKLRRKLHVFSRGEKLKTYEAELGSKGLRRKLHSGDQATPEGHYRVTELRGPGRTKYYKALMLSYPNSEDRARFAFAIRSGQLSRSARIGGLIEIHGEGGQGRDWTDGCVALTNADMDDLFPRARIGTLVTIVGTH